MDKQQFKNYYWNMEAQKYYDPDPHLPKAQDMITNKNGDCVAMQKIDGEWNMAIILEDTVLMRGRNITTTGDYKDRANMLPNITTELLADFPAGTVLLGELAFPDITKTSKDVGTIMRCLPAKAIERQKTNPLHFYVFDILAWGYEHIHTKSYQERFCDSTQFIERGLIHKIPIIKGDFMDAAADIWANGGEGIMIIRKTEPYRPGERKAWTSLKLKKELGEIKVKVIDTLAPTKEFTGDTPLESWKYFVDNQPVTKPYFYG